MTIDEFNEQLGHLFWSAERETMKEYIHIINNVSDDVLDRIYNVIAMYSADGYINLDVVFDNVMIKLKETDDKFDFVKCYERQGLIFVPRYPDRGYESIKVGYDNDSEESKGTLPKLISLEELHDKLTSLGYFFWEIDEGFLLTYKDVAILENALKQRFEEYGRLQVANKVVNDWYSQGKLNEDFTIQICIKNPNR